MLLLLYLLLLRYLLLILKLTIGHAPWHVSVLPDDAPKMDVELMLGDGCQTEQWATVNMISPSGPEL